LSKRYKSFFLFFLSLVLVLSSFIPSITSYAASINSHSTYAACTEIEFSEARFNEIKLQLPPGTAFKNLNGLPFNNKLWHDKNIIVYGNYKSVAANDFKKGTQDEYENYKVIGGYYNGTSKGEQCNGEYRYHGQDGKGNNYTNINFKHDFTPAANLSTNKWAYMPWSNKIITKDIPVLSDYNRDALRGNTKTQEWISNTAKDFVITQAFNTNGTNLESQFYNQKWNFIHVLTPPTSTHPGEGRMWHKDDGNSTRYQTFSIEQVKKLSTPVTLKLELLTPQSELNIYDTDNAIASDALVPVKIRITASLKDELFYNNPIEKVNNYTRHDISSWTVRIGESLVTGVSNYENVASKSEHTVYFKQSEIKSSGYTETIKGAAYTTYTDKKNSMTAIDDLLISFTRTAIEEPPIMIEVHPNIPDKWYDIVYFPASDGTDQTNIDSREVIIDDKYILDKDEVNKFFSGKYVFGEDKLWLKKIHMKWHTKDGQTLEAVDYTVIYPTKPNASFKLEGNYIENRKINLKDSSKGSNFEFVSSMYPTFIEDIKIKDITGNEDNIKYDREYFPNEPERNFICKKPGTYTATIITKIWINNDWKYSDPYTVIFTILEDYGAAVICNLNNSVLARGEEISAYAYEAVSTDGDTIASNIVELWYDSDNNETYDQLMQTWNNVTTFPTYTPTKLGKYKFVNKVTEEFGHETIPNKVFPEDRKSVTIEREFWVDNYIPMTGLYLDIPIVRPEVDVFFMLDLNLKSASTSWIKDNRMNINNTMRLSNIIAKVDNWDLKTYEYSQPASTTRNTGTSYPPTTTTYSSNGYSGTLNFISKSDNGYYEDNGHYATRTLSKTVTMTKDSWEMTSSGTTPLANGGYKEWEKYRATYSYDSGGYSGSTSGTGSSSRTYDKDGKLISSTSTNQPTKSGTAYKTETYWIPDMDWIHDYTGYYSGTIYKNEKQPYTAPFVTTHKKYAIYVSDENIANLADLNMVNNNNDIDIILIGNAASQSQIANDYFILNDGSSIESLVNKAIMWISEQNPVPSEDIITTQNTQFIMSESDYDQEGDLLFNKGYQYVHNKDYYDHPTGQEPDTQTTYSNTTGYNTVKKDRFLNVGLFTIYRIVHDQPTTDPNFEEYNRTSNIPYLTVAVHRIPIAQPLMTWKYNPTSCLYELTFSDQSFDLDHEYTRADKGIIDTSIRYRKDSGEWNYKMPTDLTWGNYTIEYLVKDVEQTWSDPYVLNINLSQVPLAAITIDSNIINRDMVFQNDKTIPSSEFIRLTSASDVSKGVIIKSNIPVTFAEVYINNSKVGNLTLAEISSATEYIYQSNFYDYQVPSALADGSYSVKIRAITSVGGQFVEKVMSMSVYTPVWEDYSKLYLSNIVAPLDNIKDINLSTTSNFEEKNSLGFVTSKYVNKVKLSIGSLTYYLFNDGRISLSESGAGANTTLQSLSGIKYKINNLNVNTGSYTKYWTFDFFTIVGYPFSAFQNYNIVLTGYDISGNWTTTAYKHNLNPRNKIVMIGTPIELFLVGYVDHTTQWNLNRINYNQYFTGTDYNPRGYNVFFPGEKFLLSADTIHMTSPIFITANSVHVSIEGKSFSTYLSKVNNSFWIGSLWDDSMVNWKSQDLMFLFTVNYSNGTVKTYNKIIHIDDSPYWRIHMTF